MIVERLLSVLIGYVCGNLILGFLLGEAKGVDIRKEGSGNVGATNTLRTLGKAMGFVALLCDILKVIVACVIARLLFAGSFGESYRILYFYAGLGAVLGHDFPMPGSPGPLPYLPSTCSAVCRAPVRRPWPPSWAA